MDGTEQLLFCIKYKSGINSGVFLKLFLFVKDGG